MLLISPDILFKYWSTLLLNGPEMMTYAGEGDVFSVDVKPIDGNYSRQLC